MTALTSRAHANRRRIMDIALAELLRHPDATMDQIARAAGVVRRTVYGHFPSREALITALTDAAVDDVTTAFADGTADPSEPADVALARATLAAWECADRYRLLVSLAQCSVTDAGIRARLEPVRRRATTILERGLEAGLFHSPLTPGALAHVHEHMLFGLMQAVNDGDLDAEAAGHAAAETVLAASGVPGERAAEAVRVAEGTRVPDAAASSAATG
ncbi:TetR family transcriptional regulator [Streptomyces chrestomyceticus JCM 4735]|uniref:TetR family transcriptional regulator n=1 Tax=Streptomyces chrestomyceticus JCM 4735 TaxID=1306181 RepID=A0A7U9PXX6_9ACTN|nr:TetR/AcrR family transcriptional regulator [Streptomyces chrestomyceticus]GCD34750.1 TetR family transcriptional regulator [Streptomyces chrestomyceticus JCM 4735]